MRAVLFETLVVSEWLKRRYHASLLSNLHFWRDNVGTEVDLVVEDGGAQRPIAIKSSRTVTAELFTGLRKWLGYAGARADTAMLVYAGDESYTRSGIEVKSWREIGSLEPAPPSVVGCAPRGLRCARASSIGCTVTGRRDPRPFRVRAAHPTSAPGRSAPCPPGCHPLPPHARMDADSSL